MPAVESAEDIARRTKNISEVLRRLRELPLDDFGALLLELPNARYPGLSAVLPRMADPKVQKEWTGADGRTLLRQTLTFVRLFESNVLRLRRVPLSGLKILDFGCGWGRIIRLLYYFSDPADIYGCDPWERSISICRSDGVVANLALSDYLPDALPFADSSFDLIFAFSVFTHLSERATRTALNTLARSMAPGALLAITIRPVEFWSMRAGLAPAELTSLQSDHARDGFAFLPHNRAAVDGDVTYGDTSISLTYLERKFPELKLRKVDRTLDDPYQIVLFFSK